MVRIEGISSKPRWRSRFGRGGAVFCLLMSLVLVVAVYIQANLMFWTFGLMVGALVVSLVVPKMMLKRLRVVRQLPAYGVAGHIMPVRYEVTNIGRWLPAFGVVVNETWGAGVNGWREAGPIAEEPRRLRGRPHGWLMHIGPSQVLHTAAPCWPLRRGPLAFERVVLSTSFPFGIIQQSVEFIQYENVLVYPHLYRVHRHLLGDLQDDDPRGRRQVQRTGGNEEFFGLRDYRPEDSLKLIHWRRTARTGKLVSKEMTKPSPPKLMIDLDLTGPQTDEPEDDGAPRKKRKRKDEQSPRRNLAERAISLAASVICEAHECGYQVGMTVQGAPCAPFPVEHSQAHRTKMLEALARLDTTMTMTDPAPPPAPPSMVIRTGNGEAARGQGARGRRSAVVLGAAQMEEYIQDIDPSATVSPEFVSNKPWDWNASREGDL